MTKQWLVKELDDIIRYYERAIRDKDPNLEQEMLGEFKNLKEKVKVAIETENARLNKES